MTYLQPRPANFIEFQLPQLVSHAMVPDEGHHVDNDEEVDEDDEYEARMLARRRNKNISSGSVCSFKSQKTAMGINVVCFIVAVRPRN